MARYKSFIHVERFETSKFDIIAFLKGTIYIFSKLDGTNMCAWADENGNIHCGSRSREISGEQDNAQSYLYFTTEAKFEKLRQWLIRNPDMIIFFEWLHGLNGSKQVGTIKGYITPGAWVIDVYNVQEEKYVPYDEYNMWLRPIYDQVVPPLAVLENPSFKDVESYLVNHFNLADDVLAEGIVIKNYDYRDVYGHYQVAKIVNAESKVGKGRVKMKNLPQDNIESLIVDAYVTDADCEKCKQKACVKFGLEEFEINNRTMGFYLNSLYQDLIEEELWTILKKFKQPTIQFGWLRQLVYTKGRKYLGLA